MEAVISNIDSKRRDNYVSIPISCGEFAFMVINTVRYYYVFSVRRDTKTIPIDATDLLIW